VISLFTNIPQNLALDSILNRWTLEKNTNILRDEFIGAIKLMLSSIYFTFNSKIYRQTFGTPMDSPLFPALQQINCNIPFYFRYVDDIILSAPVDQIPKIVDVFTNFHSRLRFTVEYKVNRKLSFMVKVVNGKISLDWFHKETFSGRLLSFYSNHPLCQKIRIIYSLIDRAVLLSHPKHRQKNIELYIKYLLDNGYPLKIIFEKINKRLKTLFMNKLSSNINNEIIPIKNNEKNTENDNNKKNFFVIPYIRSISEITASLINKSLFTIGFRSLNKLDKIVKVQKDRREHTQNKNIVYRINCKNCNATYMGQTKRQQGLKNIATILN